MMVFNTEKVFDPGLPWVASRKIHKPMQSMRLVSSEISHQAVACFRPSMSFLEKTWGTRWRKCVAEAKFFQCGKVIIDKAYRKAGGKKGLQRVGFVLLCKS